MTFCGVQRVAGAGGIWSFGCRGLSKDHLCAYMCMYACVYVCVAICTHIYACVEIRLRPG